MSSGRFATAILLLAVGGCSPGPSAEPTTQPAHAVCTVSIPSPSPYALHLRAGATSPAVGVPGPPSGALPPSPAASPVLRDATPAPPDNALSLPRNMKLLVIAADTTEYDLAAIRLSLDGLGVPYDVIIAREARLEPSALWESGGGHYQGIILTTADLSYMSAEGNWEGAFDADEWSALKQYESAFGVRQVTAYTLPLGGPDTYGLQFVAEVNTADTPLSARLTNAGRQLFAYLNPDVDIPIEHAWTYLASINEPATTTPLVVTADGQYAIASIHTYADGRSNLAVTAANGPALMHWLLLSYGLVDWVTQGVFLGERHVNLGVQVDDLFLPGEMWDIASQSAHSPGDQLFRLTGDDYRQLLTWRETPRPLAPDLTLELAFNGKGATGVYARDTLTPAVQAGNAAFEWVSHTYDHRTLDAISYQDSVDELVRNDDIAQNVLGLPTDDRSSLVQPSVSGLDNPEFLRAAAETGIRQLVSDSSRPEWDSPAFNTGFYSVHQPDLFIVPRRAGALFCNVSTPDEWMGQYNAVYGPNGVRAFWDHDLTVAEILDFESSVWLNRLLAWEANPVMFHQSNLRAYDAAGHSLLGVLLDATVAKYSALYSLPIRNLPLRDASEVMQRRMAYDASGVTATLLPAPPGSPGRCASVTLVASSRALIPVSGVSSGDQQEVYGGKSVSYIELEPDVPRTVSEEGCP